MDYGSFGKVINKTYLEIIYLIYMNKRDFALNNLQGLMCHYTKSNQIYSYIS